MTRQGTYVAATTLRDECQPIDQARLASCWASLHCMTAVVASVPCINVIFSIFLNCFINVACCEPLTQANLPRSACGNRLVPEAQNRHARSTLGTPPPQQQHASHRLLPPCVCVEFLSLSEKTLAISSRLVKFQHPQIYLTCGLDLV